MTDIASVLKVEITRLARKEARAQIEPLKNSTALVKAQVAALRSEVAELRRENKALTKQLGKQATALPAPDADEEAPRQRFTAKGFETMRTRLGLSYAQLALLIGAKNQKSTRDWANGDSVPGAKFQQAIFELRKLGKRDVAARLASLADQAG